MKIMINEKGDGYVVNDTTFVPMDEDNSDYRKIQEWIDEGNTPSPYTPPKVNDKERIIEELNAIIGDLTPAESMFLMLQYGMTKMNPNASDEPTPSTPLTPTGEDIITWGDRIASELEVKMIELRNL